MENYQGIMKIKTEAGEFYTEEYVRWLENNLEDARKQLVAAAISKNNLERQIDSLRKTDQISYEHGDYNNYPDDDFDR